MSFKNVNCSMVFLTLFSGPPVNAGEIAIAFDDAPRHASKLLSGEKCTALLIEKLKNANVPDVLFFVKTNNINDSGKDRINAYVASGFHLAKHGHNYCSLNKVDAKTDVQDSARVELG